MTVDLSTTTIHGLRYPKSDNNGSDFSTGLADFAADVDAKLTPFSQGLFSACPVSTVGSPGKVGRRYYATDVGLEFVDLGTSWIVAPVRLSGEMIDWPVSTPPTGWLSCDGSSLLRATYPALSALLLPVYGSADGTHFYLPDHRGRVAVMADGAAGRLSANDATGNVGGEEKHTLSGAETPLRDHQHNMAMSDLGSTHMPNLIEPTSGDLVISGDNDSGGLSGMFASAYRAVGGLGFGWGMGVGGVKGGAESGSAHNNMQPYAVINRVIKT